MLVLGVNNKKSIIIIIVIIFITIVLGIFYNQITKPKSFSPAPTVTAILPTVGYQNIPFSTEDIKKSDDNWGKKMQETSNTYPWLDQFPIQTDEYFVYFDINKKTFVAKIFSKENANLIKETIINELKNINPDYSPYPIDFQII